MNYIEGVHYYFEEINGQRVRIDKIRTIGLPVSLKTRKQSGGPKSKFRSKLDKARFLEKQKNRALNEKKRIIAMSEIK